MGELGGMTRARCPACHAEVEWVHTMQGTRLCLDLLLDPYEANVIMHGDLAVIVPRGHGDRIAHLNVCEARQRHPAYPRKV